MIKFSASIDQGTLFGFGLSESNLNRLEFNQEPILFDFGFAGHLESYALLLYLGDLETPQDVANNLDRVKLCTLPFMDAAAGITAQSLTVFPLARSIMQKFRSTPYWSYQTQVPIWQPNDQQLFFSGRTEQDIEEYLRSSGLVSPRTRRVRVSKGFGRSN